MPREVRKDFPFGLMVIVNILLATICFATPPSDTMTCHNALVGRDTPKGVFVLQQRLTDSPYYGGDVLQFREDENELFAIHRVWLGRPKEQRERRLKSPDAEQRHITKGCVNVDPMVYDALVKHHSTSTLIIR